jgi:hypothetical protein
MKKVFVVLGMIFATLIFVVGTVGVFGYAFLKQHEGEGQKYVDDAIRRIAKDWSEATLTAEASPELLKVASPAQIRGLLAMFAKRLGALKSYGGATRETYFVNFTTSGRVLTLTHSAPAVFEGGAATIKARTILRDGQWKIIELYIHSDALVAADREAPSQR